MTGIPPFMAKAVWRRDEGTCQRCGIQQTWERRGEPAGGWSIQHRKKRSQGGPHQMSNLIVLCGTGTTGCHGWVEGHPTEANRMGWGVAGWVHPTVIHTAFVNAYDGLVHITDDGQRRVVTEPLA